MTLPSATLLAQSILSGVFVGALYGLLGLGLSLSWGLLRLINLAHFAFAFLAAYICYQLASKGVDPLLSLFIIVPAFFALGAALQAAMARFAITPFNSLLLTFGLTGIVEAIIQSIWTADYRKLESSYGEHVWKVAGLYIPLPEVITLAFAAGLSFAVWAVLRYTDLGKALRASAEDAPIAAAFGIHERRNALLLTFGLTGIVEAIIQSIWTADYRKLESSYGEHVWKVAGLYIPLPEVITLAFAAGLSFAVWAVLRYTDLGRALRASAEDAPIAAAFGIHEKRNALLLAGTCSALASVAGVCLALGFTLAPSQIYAWVGVVFAAVMLGGLGRALAPLIAGVVIGVSEAVTMAVTAPSWAPLVSFTLLIAILLFRPGRAA